jgi:hypothetical protein
MRPGIEPFVPDDPWLNCHENFKHHFTSNASWRPNHTGVGISDSDLYKRATENLQWAIGEAIDKGQTLRAIGANWSFSKVAMCTGGMLQTKGLDLIFNIDDPLVVPAYIAAGKKSSNLKFVECGVQMARLSRNLEIESNPASCVSACGGSNGQTVAGATSTGTHGAALFTGAVHDTIVGIHLITGRNSHVWLERASQPVASDTFINWLGATPMRDDNLFNAAVVSFGSFGIIHGIMLETEPLFLLKEYRISNFVYSDDLMSAFASLDFDKLKVLLPAIPDSVPGHELYHMEINFNPFATINGKSGGMYVFLFYKVPVPPGFVVDQSGTNTGPSPEFIMMMKKVLSALGGKKLSYNFLKKRITQEFENNIRPATPSPKTLGSIFRDTRFTGNIASFAFAVSTADLPETIKQILAEIAVNAFAGAVAVRFVKGTEATLGFTRFEHTCVVEMDGLDIKRNHEIFANVINRLIANNIPCTIHWGKLNDPLSADRLTTMYGADKVESWKTSRETLLLPETRAVFTNDFMKKCGLHTLAV